EFLLAAEVVVDERPGGSGGQGHVIDRDVLGIALAEQFERGRYQLLAPPVDAQPAPRGPSAHDVASRGRFGHHAPTLPKTPSGDRKTHAAKALAARPGRDDSGM